MCLQHLFSLRTFLGVIPEHESVTPYYYWLQLITLFVCFTVKGNSRSIRTRDPHRLKSSHCRVDSSILVSYWISWVSLPSLHLWHKTALELCTSGHLPWVSLRERCSGPSLALPNPPTKELRPRGRVHQGPQTRGLRKSNICFCERIC